MRIIVILIIIINNIIVVIIVYTHSHSLSIYISPNTTCFFFSLTLKFPYITPETYHVKSWSIFFSANKSEFTTEVN